MKKNTLLLLFSGIIIGCQEPPVVVKQDFYPLLNDLESVMYKLETYDGIPVTVETVHTEEGFIQKKTLPVYVNGKSQFVLRDGTGVVDTQGYYVFWSKSGSILNTKYQQIPKSWIFSVEGKPSDDNQAYTLRELWINARADYEVRKKI